MCTLTFRVQERPGRSASGRLHSAPKDRGVDDAGLLTASTRPEFDDGVLSSAGYQVWFNRDERLTRGPEVPPSIETSQGVRYAAPSDSDAGGTWIAVNEFGLTLALLNGYADSRGPEPKSPTSRGQLVRSLAHLESVAGLWATSSPRSLGRYRPFVLVAIDAAGASRVLRWDGLSAVMSPDASWEVPFISSSFAQDEVRTQRGAIYDALVDDPRRPTTSELRAFQRFVDPASGPSPYTPSMQRDDAATRSFVEITVTGDEVQLKYAGGAPHKTALGPPLILTRR